MPVQRKKQEAVSDVETFIQGGAGGAAEMAALSLRNVKKEPKSDQKSGRRILSISLMEHEAEWLKITLQEINRKTSRKITRSEILAASLNILKQKNLNEMMELVNMR